MIISQLTKEIMKFIGDRNENVILGQWNPTTFYLADGG